MSNASHMTDVKGHTLKMTHAQENFLCATQWPIKNGRMYLSQLCHK